MDNFEIKPMFGDDFKASTCEIRFDALVKMYENATLEGASTPQMFSINSNFTLDFIKHGDPLMIGLAIKEMYHKLDAHIKKYERR